MRWLTLLFLQVWTIATFALAASPPFKPSSYPKHSASCKAINRASNPSASVDITLKYVDINPAAKHTILMVHGWPGLWSIWSQQILEFEDDYHLIAPDLRGFGESTHPGDTKSSGTMGDMVGDIVCVLEHANVHNVVCMGHDWGSQLCYEAARSRPDIFLGVVGAAIPYIPAAGPFMPIKDIIPSFPKLAYQIFFDTQTEKAIAELDKDIKRTLRAVLRSTESPPPAEFLKSQDSFLGAWSHIDEIPPTPFFSQEEEEYFIQQYSIQGFKHTLQFYTHENRYQSWESTHAQGNFTISQPTLAIYPSQDPVANWVLVAQLLKSASFLPNLTTKILPGGHWVHLEHSKEFNTAVRHWLQGSIPWSIQNRDTPHYADEL